MGRLSDQILWCMVGACDDTCKYYRDNACENNELLKEVEEKLKLWQHYEDMEENGRLYIMSEKVASHVKDVIAKAEYQARIKAETKHGMWMQDLDDIVCSECKTYWNVFDDCTETFKYCPNCGAKMDL